MIILDSIIKSLSDLLNIINKGAFKMKDLNKKELNEINGGRIHLVPGSTGGCMDGGGIFDDPENSRRPIQIKPIDFNNQWN
ncbi:hypothetical protein CLOBY_03530 [Clostridium saccharobutylicum]|nr:hypothetical protein CLOBY_03530 [Clostridium saccharobutylicum]OOM10921.1 hypothetical protein CLSAB_43040 [Clostridium saccharobutylicum]